MSSDSLLVFGFDDPRFKNLLSKMGYRLVQAGEEAKIPEIIGKEVIDLIVIDSRVEHNGLDLLDYLREERETKELPIVYISKSRLDAMEVQDRRFERIQVLENTCTVGKVASKIATELRFRKVIGADETKANLAEVNASLRDLTQRFRQELEEARSIQGSLLPKKLPTDNRFDVFAAYDPLEAVGGDWYYVKEISAGKVLVQIADVTGHGLAAAFIGSMTKLALTAADRNKPGELLEEMNRLMAPQLPEGRFVTILTYIYDPSTGQLCIANGGHPPALLFDGESAEVKKLGAPGFPLGFFEDTKYQEEQVTLKVGDTLIVYTDGITEAQNRDFHMYGHERLANVIKRADKTCGAERVYAEIREDFKTFLDGRILKDDVTVVVLKRTG